MAFALKVFVENFNTIILILVSVSALAAGLIGYYMTISCLAVYLLVAGVSTQAW